MPSSNEVRSLLRAFLRQGGSCSSRKLFSQHKAVRESLTMDSVKEKAGAEPLSIRCRKENTQLQYKRVSLFPGVSFSANECRFMPLLTHLACRYTIRKARDSFRSSASVTDKQQQQELWTKAKQQYDVVSRQAIVYSLYARKQRSVMVIFSLYVYLASTLGHSHAQGISDLTNNLQSSQCCKCTDKGSILLYAI